MGGLGGRRLWRRACGLPRLALGAGARLRKAPTRCKPQKAKGQRRSPSPRPSPRTPQALLKEVRERGAAVPEVAWCTPGEDGARDALMVRRPGLGKGCSLAARPAAPRRTHRLPHRPRRLMHAPCRPRRPSLAHRPRAQGERGFLSPARLALYDSKRNDPSEPQVGAGRVCALDGRGAAAASLRQCGRTLASLRREGRAAPNTSLQ
jgi:hypothetical protein